MFEKFKTLSDVMTTFSDHQKALNHFKAVRWRNGAFCPHCGHDKVYALKRKNTYRCARCRTNFSILVGTIFENTKLPLSVWFGAIWLITNHKKGIASTTLATDLGITQKSAWFVLHRLRHAARNKSFHKRLKGTVVEVDDTWIGGKDYNRHWDKKSGGRGGKGSGKTPVIGAVERQGIAVARVLDRMTKKGAQEFVRETVSNKVGLLATDESFAYQGLHEYPHARVHHESGEYVRGDAHTNTIESVWALLKRQIIGIHHWVSPKHLNRYVEEMTWRFNRRGMVSADRMNDLFAYTEGRLTYKMLIA